jgi:SsrA-binding protein
MTRRPTDYKNIIAQNRKAHHDYFILETFESGIVLTGTEVKSLRNNQASITESYIEEVNGELFLLNSHIPEYKQANRYNHQPKRNRKILLHKRQADKLIGSIRTKGLTIVPLSIYFNNKNLAKLEIALVKGKKEYDKRQTIKQDEWKREKARIMKNEFRSS